MSELALLFLVMKAQIIKDAAYLKHLKSDQCIAETLQTTLCRIDGRLILRNDKGAYDVTRKVERRVKKCQCQ